MSDNWDVVYDMPVLYHGTSNKKLPEILSNGLVAGTCFGSSEVAKYFARQTAAECGGEPIIIAVQIGTFIQSDLVPDEQMIEFPIFDDWDMRGAEWEELVEPCGLDSLQIYEAAVYQGVVCVSLDMVSTPSGAPVKAPSKKAEQISDCIRSSPSMEM